MKKDTNTSNGSETSRRFQVELVNDPVIKVAVPSELWTLTQEWMDEQLAMREPDPPDEIMVVTTEDIEAYLEYYDCTSEDTIGRGPLDEQFAAMLRAVSRTAKAEKALHGSEFVRVEFIELVELVPA